MIQTHPKSKKRKGLRAVKSSFKISMRMTIKFSRKVRNQKVRSKLMIKNLRQPKRTLSKKLSNLRNRA